MRDTAAKVSARFVAQCPCKLLAPVHVHKSACTMLGLPVTLQAHTAEPCGTAEEAMTAAAASGVSVQLQLRDSSAGSMRVCGYMPAACSSANASRAHSDGSTGGKPAAPTFPWPMRGWEVAMASWSLMEEGRWVACLTACLVLHAWVTWLPPRPISQPADAPTTSRACMQVAGCAGGTAVRDRMA